MPLRTFALPSFCYLYRLKKQKCGEKKNNVLLQELRGTVGEELGAPSPALPKPTNSLSPVCSSPSTTSRASAPPTTTPIHIDYLNCLLAAIGKEQLEYVLRLILGAIEV